MFLDAKVSIFDKYPNKFQENRKIFDKIRAIVKIQPHYFDKIVKICFGESKFSAIFAARIKDSSGMKMIFDNNVKDLTATCRQAITYINTRARWN